MQSEYGFHPIPLCEPFIGGREREYVDDCIRSGWVSSAGPYVERFEKEFARRLGVDDAVAVSSGTSALHLALIASGVGPGDVVLVSAMTFVAPVNAIRYVGAIPAFVDADEKCWQMDPGAVRRFLESECRIESGKVVDTKTRSRVAAVLPVHILGQPCDMIGLLRVAEEFGLPVIEDATESLGATVGGKPVGALGEVGCFSFNGNKLMTTGGGGMLVAKDPAIAARARFLSTQAKEPGGEYIHPEIGYNYRLTNLQAAFGCAQLEQLDQFLERKRSIARAYRQALSGLPAVEFPNEPDWSVSACWLSTILIGTELDQSRSRDLIRDAAQKGIQCRPLWQPMHQSPAHACFARHKLPVSEGLYARGVSLPSSVGLTDSDLQRVVDCVADFAR